MLRSNEMSHTSSSGRRIKPTIEAAYRNQLFPTLKAWRWRPFSSVADMRFLRTSQSQGTG